VLGKQTGFSRRSLLALARVIRQQRPAVLHTHNLGPLIYASLATLGGFTVPILHGEHGQIQPQDLTPRRLATRRLLYRCCHTVHTVSGSLLDSLRALHLSSRRMTAITNGVDCEAYSPALVKSTAREALGLPGQGITTLGIVGRFVALKRHRMLLEALEPVMRESPQVHLLVVGDHGSEREAIIAAMREHPFASRIHWLGMRSDMAACYQAMDLLVSPSEVEGLSNAVLEAMACGVPVLAHLACGNNEAIINGSGGYLHELPDAARLAAALSAIVSQPNALTEQGCLARQRAVDQFSISAMANGYLKIYRAIAGAG
jgi:glycosyltransferase involved in cell wall biosynthesis